MASLIDYALMAGGSYISSRAGINRFATPKNWTEVIAARRDDPVSGFEATYFTNGTETVISYAGTDFSQPGSDFLHGNIPLAVGIVSDQLRQAAEYYLQLKAINPNITITGHSLGGGVASLIGVFFGETTFTFDQAPFAQTARFGAIALRDHLLGQGHPESELTGLTNFIALQQASGGVPNSGLVTNLNVQGEIVSLGSSLRIGSDASIQKGTNASILDIPFAVSLHSQALLTAFLQANQTAATGKGLADVTFKLTDLLKMVFDNNLFAFVTDKSNTKDENFLERIVKHETGIGEVLPLDQMVTRFTADLWKLAQDNGLTLTDDNAGIFSSATNNVSKALTAFAMQKYYEEAPASAGYKKELFEQITGGLQFDMANVSKAFVASFQANEKLTLTGAKGFDLYFQNYLASSSFTGSERQLIQSMLPYMRDWYVQAGANGLANTDILNRGAFMLGGGSSDALVGGSATDLLVGNAGDDVLMGGAGNDTLLGGLGSDTYVLQSGDGLDTILDSDGKGSLLHDGDTLTGGAQYGDTRVYKSTDGKHLYTLTGESTLIIDGQIVVQGYDKARADLGITYSDAPVVNNPDTNNDIKGDLKPKDTNLALEGNQYDNDSLGNIIVGTEVEADRVDVLRDSAANDHIISGGGNDRIYAFRGGDDLIEAGTGQDEVYGGAGNDVIMGGADGDILSGEAGNDRIYADDQMTVAAAIAAGNASTGSGQRGDWLAGGSGDDILTGGVANDALAGGGGQDLLIGGAGDDELLGDHDWVAQSFTWTVTDLPTVRWFEPVTGTISPSDSGADVIYAGRGNDHAWGGSGNDVIFGEDGNDSLVGDEGNDIVMGGDGEDKLFGKVDNDYLDGGAGADQISGDAGDDILIGGTGNDTLEGGAGQDIYIFNKGDGVDTIVDTKSENNIFRFGEGVKSSDITLRLGSLLLDMGNGDAVHIGNFDQDDVYNSVAIDSFEFADGSILSSSALLARGFDIDGTEQNDTLTGTNITDRIFGLGGDDLLFGGAGADTLSGGDGVDELQGEEGDDLLNGNIGADTLFGGVGRDNLSGEDGADYLDGGADDDLLSGGADDDRLFGGAGADELRGCDGVDHLSGGTGNDVLAGGSDDDELFGDGGDDVLAGGSGNDFLKGGTGNDVLVADGGDDVLVGGEGNDTYVIQAGAGNVMLDLGITYRQSSAVAGLDRVVLAGSKSLTTWTAALSGNSLTLTTQPHGSPNISGVRLEGYFDTGSMGSAWEAARIEFEDGTEISRREIFALAMAPTEGDDYILGLSGDDVLKGLGGNDELIGNGGNDEFYGGPGTDYIHSKGNAVIHFDKGDGRDLVNLGLIPKDGWTTTNIIKFGPQILSSNITVRAKGGGYDDFGVNYFDLELWTQTQEFLIVRSNFTNSSDSQRDLVDRVEFADGTIWDQAELRRRITMPTESADFILSIWPGTPVLYGLDGGDSISGSDGPETLDGGNGDDHLGGGSGDDRYVGGPGTDNLFDGTYLHSDDTYVFNAGDGVDSVNDSGGIDTVEFGPDVASDKVGVWIGEYGRSLVLQVGGGDRITIANTLDSDRQGPFSGAIEFVKFADGTVWDWTGIQLEASKPQIGTNQSDEMWDLFSANNHFSGEDGNDKLHGLDGDDVLAGGRGNDDLLGGSGRDTLDGGFDNDNLHGGFGNDVYLFGRGDGQDQIDESNEIESAPGKLNILRFKPGITAGEVVVQRSGLNIELMIAGTADKVSLIGAYAANTGPFGPAMRGCKNFCVNGQLAGNCCTSMELHLNDRHERIDR